MRPITLTKERTEEKLSYIIRAAISSDLQQLTALWLEQRRYHYALDSLYAYTQDAPYQWAEQIKQALSSERECVLVAVREHQIVGYVHGGMYPWPRSPYQAYGSLNTISVTQDAQGQGVGTRLWQQLVAWFREHGVQQVSLFVDYRNRRALAFYQVIGFRHYQHRLMFTISVRAKQEG